VAGAQAPAEGKGSRHELNAPVLPARPSDGLRHPLSEQVLFPGAGGRPIFLATARRMEPQRLRHEVWRGR